MATDTDVLIVGGGPVGCALAVDLRVRGVRCTLVERDEGISYDMRAMNNSMRTMEHMRRWGIADEIRRQSRVPPAFRQDLVFCTALHGHELGVFRAYGFRPEDARELSAEPGQPMSQKYTARVLRGRAVELGADVRQGVEFTGLEQDADGVLARVEGENAPQTIRARYLVGADGGRSAVRAAAGIRMSGGGGLGKHVHAVIGSPNLLDDLSVSPGCFYVLFNPRVGGLVLPSDVDEFNLHLAGYEPDDEVSVEELAQAARIAIGRDAPVEVRRQSPYLIHELTAETYRRGRVLIAGDACHLFCPFGGFNMNTGIDDAANLGWKLAAMLAGWGGERLLDSYGEERRPIALQNGGAASDNVAALVAAISDVIGGGVPDGESAEDDAERRRLGQRLYDATYPEWNTHGIVLDQRYADSSVIVDDASDAPPWDRTVYVPLAKPGHRAPHALLDGGDPLIDRLGDGFTLLDCDGAADDVAALAAAAAARGVPLGVVRAPELAELYGAPLTLVRPDQHVAWRGERCPPDPGALIDVVRGAASR